MSVLVIGQSKDDVTQLCSYFNDTNIKDIYKFETVKATISGTSDFIKEKIDLIVFDVVFTHENHEEIYQKIEVLHAWSPVPILLSSNYDRATIEKAFEAGIFDFMLKPLDFSYFNARVHIALKYRKEIKLRQHQQSSLQKDLAIAKKVQKSLLPPPLHLKHIQFDGVHANACTLGGDMYCWFKINNDLTAVILYDVMGHGVAASLVTMSIRSLLKGMITKLIDPVAVITELNRHIYELFEDENMDRFLVTAIYMLIDTKNKTLHYVNASHPPGYLFGKYGETVLLPSNTPILGFFPTIHVKKKTLTVTGWNRIILYTDGLLNLNENQTIDNQFLSYVDLDNAYALQKFSENNSLSENCYSDDITIVSITTTL